MEENIERPRTTDDPQGPVGGQQEEEIISPGGIPVTAIEQLETENTKPKTEQTEQMEVHHHAHAHGKKNWKDYFWEFLMLFLDVFCGFLAEYYLEHRIEKERGNQFIESFYEDLKTDTAKI